MSGWDKAPDYAGSDSIWTALIGVIAAVLFSAAAAWLYFASASARTTTIAGV